MQTYKIKDLGKVITGKTPSTRNAEFYDSPDFLFVCPPDIKSVRFVTNTDKHISKIGLTTCKSMVIEPNSIMIDCIGADLGNVAISTKKCLTNQQINSITCINTNLVLPMYLYYFISTKKSFFHLIGQNGSTMPIINKTMFEKIEIDIHNKPTQQHIVNSIRSVSIHA